MGAVEGDSPVLPPFPIVTDIDEHLQRVPGEWPMLIALVGLSFRVAECVGLPGIVAQVACPVLAFMRSVLGVRLDETSPRAKVD